MHHPSPQTYPASRHPTFEYPTLPQIRATAARLAGKILHTPVWRWQTGVIDDVFDGAGEVWLKLELFQKTGTFKLRGALNCIEALGAAERARGIVAVSAGNHAVAVAYTARLAGCSATVVMPRHASAARIAACREMGATVVLMPDVHQAFARGQAIARDEGRSMLHPYEGPLTALGTATIGLELMEQVAGLEAVVVPIGGGGLCAGIAAAVKQVNPACAVYGVEPFGADAMYRSFHSGRTERLDTVDTVADSLCAPETLPYSLAVCRRFVDEVVRVTDDEICRAMLDLFRDAKLVAEPAAAVATAALLGPLRGQLAGRKTALIVCGSNIDATGFAALLARGAHVRDAALAAATVV
ncbi:pyridoxal-phosphate dependent enzyme [Massilia dura]|uniref:Pyridoxal-phosphate dependent enzyme n=1 Tax=Pseudoduganella dura TaxID=321982 RepID=A0A6I3XP56_9BURK|nr:threonine/serine dehydratase [Pseudoduganella dura]MUI16233.1 pyridoxal-phosphate dependent enzyme [Pseudoduganella dura]GGY05024.1 serine/threonine dehydratase [Pseudoduganella dura]